MRTLRKVKAKIVDEVDEPEEKSVSKSKKKTGRAKKTKVPIAVHSDTDDNEREEVDDDAKDSVGKKSRSNRNKEKKNQKNGHSDSENEVEDEDVDKKVGQNGKVKDLEENRDSEGVNSDGIDKVPSTPVSQTKRKIRVDKSKKKLEEDDGSDNDEKVASPPSTKKGKAVGRSRVSKEVPADLSGSDVDTRGEEADHSDSGSDGEEIVKPSRNEKVEEKGESDGVDVKDDELTEDKPQSKNKIKLNRKGPKVIKENGDVNENGGDPKEETVTETKKKPKEPEGNYEVEQVVDMQTKQTWKCPVKFRVRWVGFGEKDDTWLSMNDVSCEDLIQDFLEISGRKSEYERTLETKREHDDKMVRVTSKRTFGKQVYYGSDDDDEIIVPRGTKSRKLFLKTSFAEPKKDKKAVKPYVKAFEVESIESDRIYNGEQEYKVKWKGFKSSSNSWLHVTKMNCPSILNKYKKAKARRQESSDSSSEGEAWQVDKVLDSRIRNGQEEYLVRWNGYTQGSDTWEPEENLQGCKNLLDRFRSTKQTKRKSHKKQKKVVKKKKLEEEDSEEENSDAERMVPREKVKSTAAPIVSRMKRTPSKSVKYADSDSGEEEKVVQSSGSEE